MCIYAHCILYIYLHSKIIKGEVWLTRKHPIILAQKPYLILEILVVSPHNYILVNYGRLKYGEIFIWHIVPQYAEVSPTHKHEGRGFLLFRLINMREPLIMGFLTGGKTTFLTETSIPVPVKQVSMIRNWPRWAKWFNSRTGMSPRRFIWPSLETQLKWCTWYVFSILPEFVWVLAFCIHLLDSELALLGGFKSISTVLSDNGKFKQGHKGSLLYGWYPHIISEAFIQFYW